LAGFNERIVALYARGMTTRDIRAHLRQMYDVEVSSDLISRVTAGVIEELAEWQSRPLDASVVDRLGAHRPLRPARVAAAQPPADLRRRPPPLRPPGHHGRQGGVGLEHARLGPAAPQMCLPVRIPGQVAAAGLAVAGDLPVDGLVALADPDRDDLDRLTTTQPVGDLDPVVWLRNRGLTGTSMKATRPASMNHSDPQLSDTPTRCEACEPDKPDRISSKYRRLVPCGILSGAYLGMRTPH
jgi:hypothetical protein